MKRIYKNRPASWRMKEERFSCPFKRPDVLIMLGAFPDPLHYILNVVIIVSAVLAILSLLGYLWR